MVVGGNSEQDDHDGCEDGADGWEYGGDGPGDDRIWLNQDDGQPPSNKEKATTALGLGEGGDSRDSSEEDHPIWSSGDWTMGTTTLATRSGHQRPSLSESIW